MNIFILTGQFIVGLVFVASVINDIFERNILLATLETKFESLFKHKVPYTPYLVYGGMGLKVICGLGLMFNILVPVAAFFLAGFTMIANILFNNFWTQQGLEYKSTLLVFLHNWAIVGGLIVLIGV